MKPVFRLCQFVSTYLFILYIFPSCNVVSVIVKNGDTTTGKLTLVDAHGSPADTLWVDAGQRIKWIIDKDSSNVRSMDSMPVKPGNNNIFKRHPHKKVLSSKWKGRVEKHLLTSTYEDYYVHWTDVNGNHYTCDPRIQIR
ncbi:MAG: hypothetical protein ABI416_14980 [Ginsengibacter sp.]